ncbi:MAG: CsgG/HfaB family protein [Kiritimatiellae bacterium]|nr:CsgG/HfaB family protein [Kiritimatiellia bacterium]
MRKSVLTGALMLGLVLNAGNAWALWGKATTSTESGNADMKLGEYKGLKHAIGVKGFDNEAGWRGSFDIGNNLSIMLESALMDSGRFVVVEREKLTDVIAEQDLAASGRTAKAKDVAQTGKIRPAKYLATGAVTEVEEEQSGTGGGIGFGGFRVGGSKSEAQVTVIVKLIDTTTGEIVAKERVVGKAGKSGLDLGMNKFGIDADLGGFKKTPMGQAAQDCINQAAAFIAKKMEEFPFDGSVVKAGSNGVIINRGEQFGVTEGMILVMAEEGEVLMDPDTGEVLDKEEGEQIGRLKVTKVREKISYCDVIEGEEDPEPGTVVLAE